jgi:hypothetical protein
LPLFFGGIQIEIAITASIAALTTGFALYDRWRARHRNAHACCARCGQHWAHAYPDPTRFLVQGAEICAPCAQLLRERMPVLMRRLMWTVAIGTGWMLYEAGLVPVLGGWFAPAHLLSWIVWPLALAGGAITVLSIARRQNLAVLNSRVRVMELADGSGPAAVLPISSESGGVTRAASAK